MHPDGHRLLRWALYGTRRFVASRERRLDLVEILTFQDLFGASYRFEPILTQTFGGLGLAWFPEDALGFAALVANIIDWTQVLKRGGQSVGELAGTAPDPG